MAALLALGGLPSVSSALRVQCLRCFGGDSMSNNRIEEGCLAVLIHSTAGNDGKFVTVGKFIGQVYGWVGDRRWEIDRVFEADIGGFFGNHMQEHQLLRIDNYKPETADSLAEELEGVQ